MTTTFEEQIAELHRGAHEVLVSAELIKKLQRGKPLKVKAGFDPTAPDLHLGHTVLLNKMRQFQQFGHDVTFLIGDFTGMIGDPTDRNSERPMLSVEDIHRNLAGIREQFSRYIDFSNDRALIPAHRARPRPCIHAAQLRGASAPLHSPSEYPPSVSLHAEWNLLTCRLLSAPN